MASGSAIPRSGSELPKRVAARYRAPLGCPTAEEFVEYVEGRTPRLQLVAASAATGTAERVLIRIHADPHSPGWIGEIEIEGSSALQREVRGERCGDVALALALITVLRLERGAGEEGAAERRVDRAGGAEDAPPAAALGAEPAAPGTLAAPAPVPLDAPALESSAGVPDAARALTAPAPEALPRDPSTAVPADVALPVPAPDETSERAALRAELPVAGEGGALSAAAPGEALGAAPNPAENLSAGSGEPLPDRPAPAAGSGGRFDIEPVLNAYAGYASAPSHAFKAALQVEGRWGGGVSSWAAALGLAYGTASQQSSAGNLAFRLLAAELELCPPGVEGAGGVWLRGCAALRGGGLDVRVRERELPLEIDTTLRPWLALGPSLHLGVPVSARWSLRALAAVSFLLVRDRFEVERVVEGEAEVRVDSFSLYRPPVASFDALLGLGYQF